MSRMCNRRSSVLTVVNDLYVGAFQQFHAVWQSQQKTIADSGFVLAGHCAQTCTEAVESPGLVRREGAQDSA